MTELYQILSDISKATTPDQLRNLILDAIKHKEPDDGLILTFNDKSITLSSELCSDHRSLESALQLIWNRRNQT